MTSKERAYLIHLSASEPTVLYVGKQGISPDLVNNLDEALTARELVKVGLQKTCFDDIHAAAATLAERSRSQVVQVIGRKMVFYRTNPERKHPIEMPR